MKSSILAGFWSLLCSVPPHLSVCLCDFVSLWVVLCRKDVTAALFDRVVSEDF